ncbi:MAG: nicotinate phosphoribosyltransferase, partial [Planctomycetota bacterium]
DQTAKTTIPGILATRRFIHRGQAVADMIYDTLTPESEQRIFDPADPNRSRRIESDAEAVELLQPVFRGGDRIASLPTLQRTREYARQQVELLHASTRRLHDPHPYPVGLAPNLHRRRMELAKQMRAPDA